MNYELAKKLQDAGFFLAVKVKCDYTIRKAGEDDICLPTLEELIDACGSAFTELEKLTHTVEPEKWIAKSFPCEECGIAKITDGFGSNPIEAVANLWLALNQT